MLHETHDCSKCAHTKEYLDAKIDEEDIDVYEKINVKLSNARQASQPNTLDTLSNVLTEKQKEEYFEKSFIALEEAKLLEVEWWDHMKYKYHLNTDKVFVDVDNCKFYVCKDSCGKFQINFKSKEDANNAKD